MQEENVALNRRSHVITDGDARAANRSMLYPVGFSAADFGKPIVGVPHGHSTMTPCNAGILSLVNRAVDADFHRVGGVPQVLKILLENDRVNGDCITITG